MTGIELVEQDIKREVAPVLVRANTIVVRSTTDRAEAMEFLKAVKGAQKRASEFFAPIVDTAHKAWKQATVSRASMLDPLDAAEKSVKLTITTWDRAEEEKRLAEQRRLQAIVDEAKRKERQKAEQEAAKQRAIQEQKEREAAEARRKAEEADGAERKRLLAEAEAAERKAAAADAKAEVKEEQAAAVIGHTVTVAGPEKQKGESTSTRWKAEMSDKALLIAAAANGSETALACLEFNQVAANRLATALTGEYVCPGVKRVPASVLSVRSER